MMRRLVQTLVAVWVMLGATSAFAQKAFVRDDIASDAVRLEEQLRKDAGSLATSRPAADLARDAAQLIARNTPLAALRPLAAAITATPRDAALWLLYARTARAAAEANNNNSYTLSEQAVTAAYVSYQRATRPADEASALAALGDIYAKRSMWRPALDAYAASLKIADNQAVRAAYEPLLDKYGFRILEYKVDSDSASPRACFQFSDPLARGKVDFAPYVAVSGATNAAISTEDQQLCVEGLKHGDRYAIVLRQGLPSSVGETLRRNADYEIYVRDRAPQVRFTGKNYVLPRVGQEGIPVVSVNTPKVAVDILRVGDRNLLPTVRGEDFLSQLGSFRVRQLIDGEAVKVWSGTLDTQSALNQDVTTAFPVMEAVGKMEPGVYVMVARAGDKPMSTQDNNDDDYGTRATQWFVVSDLGLTAFTGDDGIHVLVRSLATAEPMKGVDVRLVARSNEILATLPTDADGHVRFDPGLSRGAGGLAPGLVVASDSRTDYNFLDLVQTAFDLTDRGVKGRTAPKALDAFVFPERGVYRSGETVNVTTLLRDAKGSAVPALPVTLVVKRPDGVEYRRAAVEDQGQGGRAWSLAILSGAPTGTWRIQAYVDPKSPAIGEASFLVEDYVPERLDLVLKPQDKSVRAGETTKIDTETRYLYGAPGAGLDITGEVTVQATDGALPGFPGFVAGLQDESFEAVKADLEDTPTTDAKGLASVTVPIADVSAPRPVEAKIIIRAGETGGRAIERVLTIPVLPKGGVIGVKKNFADLAEGATATFDVIALAGGATRAARKDAQWSLYRVSNDYQWYNSDGRWGFERVKSSRRIADGRIDIAADQPGRISAAVGWGTHRLDIRGDSTDAPTSITFEVGWSGDASSETPDLLEVSLDKPDYRPADTMKLRIASRFDGKATVAIIGDKVSQIRTLDVRTGDNQLELPVSADWGTGAYAVAIAHRPLDQKARRMPGRALGLAWFGVDQDARKLAVAIEAPPKIEPRHPVTLPVRIAGLQPGEDAQVTLAAVDIGILNLTRYQAPDPTSWFFGQKQLSTEIRDLYGLMIDGMQGVRGAIRSGGDGGAKLDSGQRPSQEPLSRYSGVVKVGTDGLVRITFDIPAFNGSMRVMAVAWTKNRVGAAQADVIVRDPVIVQATLPRFLALGDQSRFHLQIDNVEGQAGDYRLDVDVHGPVTIAADALTRTFRLDAKGRTAQTIPIVAAGVGMADLDVKLVGPGATATQHLAINVEAGTSDLYRRTVRQMAPGTSVTVTDDIVADFLPGTAAVSVAVSPFGAIDVPALLQALDRYPYGCSEQLVSRAMPLLYVNKLAAMEQLALDAGIDARVKDTIERVLARQASNGAIGLWGPDSAEDVWLHAFVTDFLTRARENNYVVAQRSFDLALDYLRNQVTNANTGEIEVGKGEPIAYALYVLARNGRPVMGDLRYLADTKLGVFTSPLARAQLAAALALLGDRGRAQTVLSSATQSLEAAVAAKVSRPDYGTRLRDSAGILALAAESGLARADILKANVVLESERSATSYSSTQENAWMVLAAEALTRDAPDMSLTIDGAAHKGSYYHTWRGFALTGQKSTIANSGSSPAQVVITSSGNPVTPEPAASQGYSIERGFYRTNGNRIEPNQIRQNDRLVVVLKVTEPEAAYGKLMLVDRLPAGLEIDNPDLFDGGSVDELSWIKSDVQPTHTEYRDDRFVATFERNGSDKATFAVAYIVRAVTPGRYVLPPATIEDMYRPQRFGRTAFGSVEVTGTP